MAAGTESPMQRGHHVVPLKTSWLRERLFRCWSSQQLVPLLGRDHFKFRRNLFAATVSKSTATAAPSPVVKYIQPAPTFQTAPATITRHEQGRHSRRVATVSGFFLRAGLQNLQECPRVLELRLAIGCCVFRFPSFPRLDHDAVVLSLARIPRACCNRTPCSSGLWASDLRFDVDEIRVAVNTRVCKVESPA